MVKLEVLKTVGKVIDVGIHEISDAEFARQLVEKGLAILLDGEIPEKEIRKNEKSTTTKKKG
jgi:hypothetical protein